MANTSILATRFSELVQQLAAVEATKKYEKTSYMAGYFVDDTQFLNWKVKAKNLLDMTCGKNSVHYAAFIDNETGSYVTSFDILQGLKAVFSAAKEDYEGGFFNSVRNLVQAEVFASELDQARELLTAGYATAAAVIAGVVLETTIRQICTDRGIAHGKLDRMNGELARAGIYNLLVQKKITALADIRNNAAHGRSDQFKHTDVSEMVTYIESFVADQR